MTPRERFVGLIRIVRFSSEFEDVQTALFEMRRFVAQTEYLVQASAVSATLRQTACANAAPTTPEYKACKAGPKARTPASWMQSTSSRSKALPIFQSS